MGQQLSNPVGRLRRQPRQYITQVGVGIKAVEIGRVDEAHHDTGTNAGEPASSPSCPAKRRHLCTRLALRPKLIATWATDAPGAAHAATTWRFRSAS